MLISPATAWRNISTPLSAGILAVAGLALRQSRVPGFQTERLTTLRDGKPVVLPHACGIRTLQSHCLSIRSWRAVQRNGDGPAANREWSSSAWLRYSILLVPPSPATRHLPSRYSVPLAHNTK